MTTFFNSANLNQWIGPLVLITLGIVLFIAASIEIQRLKKAKNWP
jgi:hypothetical protein